MAIYSLGHSTHSQEDFIEICRAASVDIIDVRSHPGSSHSPQFGKEAMEKYLPEAGIGYEWWPELGGWTARHAHLIDEFSQYGVRIESYTRNLFPKHRIAKRRPVEEGKAEAGFLNWGFEDYSFFQTLPEYFAGIERLITQGHERNVAIICCEICWTRCHRAMIADHLAYLGEPPVIHLCPRSRKTLLPRIVVSQSEHNVHRHMPYPKNRLLRYNKHILECWCKHREQWRSTMEPLESLVLPDPAGLGDVYDAC